MRMPAIHEITDIAETVRQEFETGSVCHAAVADAVANHHPHGTEWYMRDSMPLVLPTFPRMSCDYGTAFLRERLGHGQVIEGTYGGMVHTFLLLGESALGKETILDITADQYAGPRVYIGPLVKPWSSRQTWRAA